MKKLKFTLAALILSSALAFTGCKDTGDDPARQNNSRLENSESNVFLAAAVPSASESIPDSEAPTTSTSDVSSMPELEGSFTSETNVSSAPQGSCPDCDGTGHHNNTVCGTCNGSGLYCEPAAPQGSCPDCNGTGHHNNTVCGTCNGSGLYCEPAAPQGGCPDCDGTGRHNNTVCGTCNGSGLYCEPAAPQGNCPDCDGTGHHNNAVCGTCNGSGWCTVQSHHGGEHHQNRSHHRISM